MAYTSWNLIKSDYDSTLPHVQTCTRVNAMSFLYSVKLWENAKHSLLDTNRSDKITNVDYIWFILHKAQVN